MQFWFFLFRSDDESANEYEEEEISLKQELQEDDSNSGWQEVIRWVVDKRVTDNFTEFCEFYYFSSEEVETSPVVEYVSAPHPQLAHLPQLPHPLSVTVKTVKGKIQTYYIDWCFHWIQNLYCIIRGFIFSITNVRIQYLKISWIVSSI